MAVFASLILQQDALCAYLDRLASSIGRPIHLEEDALSAQDERSAGS